MTLYIAEMCHLEHTIQIYYLTCGANKGEKGVLIHKGLKIGAKCIRPQMNRLFFYQVNFFFSPQREIFLKSRQTTYSQFQMFDI